MIQNLFSEMTELFREQLPDFFVNNKLNKNKLTDAAYSYDKNLLKALLTHEALKKQFFVEVEKTQVFKQREFLLFLNNKSFLQDSYTRFKNEIGLQDEYGRYFRENTDVVLTWPHKDCILEGGQTKEDQNREEIFYNETLAPDEIDRLVDAKALTNFTLFDKNGEHKLNPTTKLNIREQNLIIKGNNLLALHSLKTRKDIAGKVKLIYIDPPYNTGNDGFRYNDKFNHSSWLTFMKNRLVVAKQLLRDDGVIFVQCDDNEQAYLKILMDEVFENGFINNIVVEMSNLSGNKIEHAIQGRRFPKIKEYILLYAKNKAKYKLDIPKSEKGKWDDEYNMIISNLDIEKFNEIKKNVSENNEIQLNEILSSLKLVSLNKYSKDNDIVLDDKWKFNNSYRIVASKPNTALRKKALIIDYNQELFALKNQRGDLKIIKTDFNRDTDTARIEIVFAEDNSKVFFGDIWFNIVTTGGVAQEGGVVLANGKKPEYLLHKIIFSATKKGDIVLDYHLGSGTTAAVAHKMKRRYIGIEQMDYIETIAVERLKKVIAGEQGGISKTVNWQGGGSFLYCELKEHNEEYIQKIQEAKTNKDLWEIWQIMKSESFLRIEIDKDKFTEEAFNELELDDQKKLLIETLDKNHLYVNLSEIEDKDHKMSPDEVALNKSFYNIS